MGSDPMKDGGVIPPAEKPANRGQRVAMATIGAADLAQSPHDEVASSHDLRHATWALQILDGEPRLVRSGGEDLAHAGRAVDGDDAPIER